MTSTLARRVGLEAASSKTDRSEFCCLIYATQNGWKLPIFFEEMGVPRDWALVDFEKNEQRSEQFLKCRTCVLGSTRMKSLAGSSSRSH